MRVTRLGAAIPLMTFGTGNQVAGASGTVLTSDSSNSTYWGENIARITANGSNANTLVGPFVNVAAGANVTLATSSNTLTITGTGGIASITANGSNSLTGTVNLQAGSGMALDVSAQTIIFTNTGGSGGAGGAANLASAKYRRTSGDYTTTSNTFVDVDATNLALTIVTGQRRVAVTLTGSGYNTNSGDFVGLDVDLDGTRMVGGNFGVFIVPTPPQNISFTIISNLLTAGSHTFKLQFRRFTTGTVTLYGTGNSQLSFSVVELYAA